MTAECKKINFVSVIFTFQHFVLIMTLLLCYIISLTSSLPPCSSDPLRCHDGTEHLGDSHSDVLQTQHQETRLRLSDSDITSCPIGTSFTWCEVRIGVLIKHAMYQRPTLQTEAGTGWSRFDTHFSAAFFFHSM